MGSKRKVFLIETMGGYCGYLVNNSEFMIGLIQYYQLAI